MSKYNLTHYFEQFKYYENGNSLIIKKYNHKTDINYSKTVNDLLEICIAELKIPLDNSKFIQPLNSNYSFIKITIDPMDTIINVDDICINLLQYLIYRYDAIHFGNSFEMKKLFCKSYYSLLYGLNNNITNINELFNDKELYSFEMEKICIENEKLIKFKFSFDQLYHYIKIHKYRSIDDIYTDHSFLKKEYIDTLIKRLINNNYIFYVRSNELYFYNKDW